MSVSAADFYKSDSQLAAQLSSLEFEKYSQIASKESIQAAKVALELKKHVCHVVSNSSEALELIKKIVPDGKSVMNAASTTLAQIGLIDYLKNQSKWNNLHPAILAEKDPAKGWALRCQALLADFYFSSVSAVTEDGGFIACDLSGTRIGAFAQAAGHIVLVVGANKVVKDIEAARKRQQEYCLALESARVRVAYGIPASSINNTIEINGANPFAAPGRFIVVIVEESLGF